jgi:2-dehydro-3-deoxygalactonokinase
VTEPRRSALIAIDWGTTSARAYRLDDAGAVIDARSAPLGIQAVADRRWREALDTLLGDWRDDPAPRIASGMIGSRQGWVEAPYVDCPADLARLGAMLTRTPGGELAIVPGARCVDSAGIPDVIRGEETEVAGSLGSDAETLLAVLPGTHSKWVLVEGGRITRFATYMTGELYALLLAHSILGRMADPSPRSVAGEPFARGVDRGLRGGGLSHAIFGARTLALAGELSPGAVSEWLSGALIGNEIGAARAWATAHRGGVGEVTLIGADPLVARYASALAQAGVDARAGPADAAARGLYRIAQRAGIIR